MPRRRTRHPPKTTPAEFIRRTSLQTLSDASIGICGQSRARLSLDISASTVNFDLVEPNNTNVPEAIEGGHTGEIIQVEQTVSAEEIPIQLEIELTVGNTRVETRRILANRVAQARRIIANATRAGNVEQNNAIDEAVRFLYPYAPREGQCNALQHLVYKREDFILIAKTSFGKSMILQAVSVLIHKSITVVVLPLNQIGQEQAEYISRIGGTPCFLNADTISVEILTDIRNGKYTHILISPELAIGDKFHTIAT